MKYSSTIEIEGDIDHLHQCLLAEDASPKADRSTCNMKKTKNHLIFTITATDAVALRASANSIMKLLSVYEKAEKIQ